MALKHIQRLVLIDKANQLAFLAPVTSGSRYVGHDVELQNVIALNRRVLAHMPRIERSPRVALSMDAPCGTNGIIGPQLEFVMFAAWLVIDGRPGLTTAPGPVVEYDRVLRTVAVASAIMHQRANPVPKVSGEIKIMPKARAAKITAAQMRDHWDIMFNEQIDQAVFKSRLKSAARHLEGYLDHLATQPLVLFAKTGKMKPRKSPHLKKVLLAMSARTTAG